MRLHPLARGSEQLRYQCAILSGGVVLQLAIIVCVVSLLVPSAGALACAVNVCVEADHPVRRQSTQGYYYTASGWVDGDLAVSGQLIMSPGGVDNSCNSLDTGLYGYCALGVSGFPNTLYFSPHCTTNTVYGSTVLDSSQETEETDCG